MKYFEKEDISKIIDYLEPYKNKLDDEGFYKWKTNASKLETILNKTIDLDGKTDFEKVIEIKRILSEINLINHIKFKDISLWIVKDWGGIKGIKEETLIELIKNLDPNEDDYIGFNNISSVSKIKALNNPKKYIIYDSRVAYTMNWIILSRKAGKKFFPIPESRNSKLKNLDIKTLIQLSNIDSDKKDLYVPQKETYKEFNNLVLEINKELYSYKEPFYTEMLLFALADREIIDDILSKVHLSID